MRFVGSMTPKYESKLSFKHSRKGCRIEASWTQCSKAKNPKIRTAQGHLRLAILRTPEAFGNLLGARIVSSTEGSFN